MKTSNATEEPGKLYQMLRADIGKNWQWVMLMLRKDSYGTIKYILNNPDVMRGKMVFAPPTLPVGFHPPTSRASDGVGKDTTSLISGEPQAEVKTDDGMPDFSASSPFPQDDWKELAGQLRRRRKRSSVKKKISKQKA
jgi:hypothetical protein